ncbi:CRS2-associated factor 2, mitochondrial [Salvia divinorum]|uniref:CRS2-associated factor 2, mitochondrial n=1 Tax=Salvia divinorum TaxID=28513 RepID=A0ABD1HL34_SALDI
MLKLFSWRPAIHPSPSLFTHLPAISRFLSHSPPSAATALEEIHDPPFSLKRAETPQNRTTIKSSKKKDKKPKVNVNSNSVEKPPELPFDFMYSYSEISPGVEPIGFREPPKFSPFGPGRLDRNWTGTTAPATVKPDLEKLAEDRRKVIGDPIPDEEVAELVEKYRHSNCSRQINLGRGGVTHNTLEDIHSHWKRAEAVRIKCLGVPTLDMDNICFHLEDKTGGKIIYRHLNILLLYRGRNYDLRKRPRIPLMLWKPHAPIYPKLVKNVADGLTFEETKEKRNRGLNSPPIMKLTRNGVYVNVVEKVRTAFETDDVVRLDCTHVGSSDCKKIGVKLRDLVPCVPILFKDEQIILWKGKKDGE